jgi:hypothetical protein
MVSSLGLFLFLFHSCTLMSTRSKWTKTIPPPFKILTREEWPVNKWGCVGELTAQLRGWTVERSVLSTAQVQKDHRGVTVTHTLRKEKISSKKEYESMWRYRKSKALDAWNVRGCCRLEPRGRQSRGRDWLVQTWPWRPVGGLAWILWAGELLAC